MPESVTSQERWILVPMDFSESSRTALSRALALAPALGATIELVHVVDFSGLAAGLPGDPLVDTGGVDEADAGPLGRHIAEQARAAIREADLVLFGQQSSDADGAVLWAAVSDRLRRPMVSQVAGLTLDGGSLTGKRQTEFGYDVISAPLPAVVASRASAARLRAALTSRSRTRPQVVQV